MILFLVLFLVFRTNVHIILSYTTKTHLFSPSGPSSLGRPCAGSTALILLPPLVQVVSVESVCVVLFSGFLSDPLSTPLSGDGCDGGVTVGVSSKSASISNVLPLIFLRICGPLMLNLLGASPFFFSRCWIAYRAGAFATNVAARNSAVVHVMRIVSEVALLRVVGRRTAVTATIRMPIEKRKPS